jgi:ABC-type lipoprotein export system ATPase subunit
MNDLAVEVRDLHKTYRLGRVDLHVLRGVSLRVRCGEFVSVVGASGSGKSTLLHLIGLLDRPDKGHVILHGVDAAGMRSRQRNRVRCRDVGFVFQFYHLLAELNVLDNTLLPAKVDSSVIGWFARRNGLRKRAAEILARLGLQERLRHRPKELSGGERQRVAIARALINRPKLLLADEPTGNLDSKTGKQIMDVLKQVNRETGQTILLVTHDASLAEQTDRILRLRDGKLDG